MNFLGYAVAFISVIVLSSIWSGYALSVLWAWFIVPAFGLPKLSIPLAIGLALIVSYLTHQLDNREKDNRTASEVLVAGIATSFVKPLIVLLTGWVVKLYI